MKSRVEPQGLHYYCRQSGTHILFDEIKSEPNLYSIAPRTVSIAITDECDFTCSYCYVNLSNRYLPKEKVISYCRELDRLGTFDIAFGGGEPTLHPDLLEICHTIWEETNLGISITTHGHHLNEIFIENLKNKISFIRISIDGGEPVYSQLRKKPLANVLQNLKLLSGKIPFGINTVVNKLTVRNLDSVKEIFRDFGGSELLLLPMWNRGKYVLTLDDWDILNNWIQTNYQEIPISISSDAKPFLSVPLLFKDDEWFNDYAFIGIDSTFRKSSFLNHGLNIENYPSIEELLQSRITSNNIHNG
jgi:MoaA/NifB/PqqE/SkfB family radical SAM enzyme